MRSELFSGSRTSSWIHNPCAVAGSGTEHGSKCSRSCHLEKL